ncbi:MAG: 30S ribosomal protein S9 [Chloroflexi bacterium]|nr:30S ribosomal protein S9 [Chloroflexota bacterium]
MVANYHPGTGRRKTSIARVRLFPGDGQILVNGKTVTDYFGGRQIYENVVTQPFRVTNTLGKFNAMIKVMGGGVTGQAGAVRHGIARALATTDENLRSPLKKAGLLIRDSRMKERKKPGLKRARKAPQYTKR